jgi:hypothetical protein
MKLILVVLDHLFFISRPIWVIFSLQHGKIQKSNKGLFHLFLKNENDQTNAHTMTTLQHSLGERIIARGVDFLKRAFIAHLNL